MLIICVGLDSFCLIERLDDSGQKIFKCCRPHPGGEYGNIDCISTYLHALGRPLVARAIRTRTVPCCIPIRVILWCDLRCIL